MDNGMGSPWIRRGMYVLMGMLGVTITMVAPMLDGMLREYRLPLSLGGMFTGAMSVGGLLAIVLLGIFSDRMSKTKIVIWGYFVFAAALVVTCFAPSYSLLLLCFAVSGVGSKAVDTLSNAVIKDAHTENSGTYLNLMHMFLGNGAIAGPLISGGLLNADVSWKAVFAGMGILCALITFAFTVLMRGQKRAPRPAVRGQAGSANVPIKGLLADRRVWIFCLVLFFYTGHQSCINTWISLYFQKQFGYNEGLSGLALAMYWLGIVVSRLFCSRFYSPKNAKRLLIAGGALGTFVLAGGILIDAPAVLLVALLLCGALTGGTIPVVIDLACGFHVVLSGAMTSLLYVCMNVSPFIFPLMMGSLSDACGMRIGISIAVLSLALMCIAISLIANRKEEM